MNKPLSITDELLNRLDADTREEYEERAAIMQYESGLPRGHAECLALLDVFKRHPMALLGLRVLKAELEGETQFIVTTKVQAAYQHLSSIGRIEQADLASVLDSEFNGMASLAKIAILFEG